ncbi:MAG: recombination regulator RecX [Gammaproteobacteria bacterium]|jgi:regulatory protein|nr:recombination regulator RecX [Gammaproteobacteria bacterium]
MDLLARREHSRSELVRKLKQRGFSAPEVGAALDRLADEGLQSDARFAEALTLARQQHGYGPRRIVWELREKGVGDEMIAAHVDSSDSVWAESAREQREKRFGTQPAADVRERKRQTDFLVRRGFTGDQVRRAMGESD